MSVFQQGMILRNTCTDKHVIYIQDIPDVGYGKNCIVYNLDMDRYIVSDDRIYECIEDDCPIVNTLHTKALMTESYKAYIRNASQGSLFIAEQVLEQFQQLENAELLLTDGSTFTVKNVHLVNDALTTDWMGRIQFDGIRYYKGNERLQSSTLAHLRPNSMLLDALCKPIEDLDK